MSATRDEVGQRHVDLNENVDALIENPLRSLNLRELMEDVQRFAEEKDLVDILPDLKRGAYVAKDPKLYEQVARGKDLGEGLPVILTGKEKEAIKNEKDALFKQSKDLYITILTCSAAALLQGWDQTGSNSANLFWPQEFGLNYKKNRDDWLIGLVNAAPYISSALIGCLLTDPINSRFGRRGTIFFAGIWCFASVIGSAFCYSWQTLFVTRLCLGVGMGSKASTVAVFAAESSPAYFRGSIVMSWQLWVASGIFLGFSASLMVFQTGDNAWRLMLGSACIPAIPLLILVYIAPESPRWYMKQGKNVTYNYDKAYKAMSRLRNTQLQACRDFYLAHKQLELERVFIERQLRLKSVDPEQGASVQVLGGISTYFVRFGELFTTKRVRRATLAACTIMLAQQLCGINVLAFYSSTLFTHTNSDIRSALLFSWGFGLVNTVFALPAVRNIDTFGRRSLLLVSIFGMFWMLLAAGLCFTIPTDNSARTGLIAFFLFLFAAAYSPGEGPVPFTYSAEAFPLSHREVGMSLAVATNLFFAGVLTAVFPRLNTALGDTGSLGLFAGFNVLAFIMIFLWVPETAQRTLEELSHVFGVPTWQHAGYQIDTYLPWFFKRYLLWNRAAELKPLYKEFSAAPNRDDDEADQTDQVHPAHEDDEMGNKEGVAVLEEEDIAPDQIVAPRGNERRRDDAASIVSTASSDHS